MRRLLGILFASALALAISGAAGAAVLFYDGSLYVQLAENPPIKVKGTGVATVDGGIGSHISTLALATNLTGTRSMLITDPNVPTVATLIHAGVAIRNAALKPMSTTGPLTANTMPVPGNTKICLLFAGCANWLDILHTELQGTATVGIGIGGIITVNGFGAGLRISIIGAPWTVHTAGKLTGVYTTNAMVPPASRPANETRSWPAFQHDPGSATSSTAQTGGAIQMVSAAIVSTTLMPPSNLLTLESTLTLNFTPEPGLMLLLASGVAGLALLGRNRMHR